MENRTEIMRRLNFVDAGVHGKLSISPDVIPTMIPASTMDKWQSGDDSPYYKLQMIEFPVIANGLVYEESFFQSFIKKLNERPIPGSKAGHSFFPGERPPTDFLLVGAKLESDGNGTGRVYFKNYIPPSGESGSNEVFIRENESDMVHYSLVTYPKEIIENNADGETVIRIVESIFGERNDAVEYGTGAMKQATNHADVIGEKKNNGETTMTKKEILESLNTLRENGDITLSEVAVAMGLEKKLVTDNQVNSEQVLNKISEMGIEDPVAEIERLRNINQENVASVREAKISEIFGPSEKDENGKEKNLLRDYVSDKVKNVAGEELDAAIAAVKENPIAQRLASEKADPYSAANRIGTVEKTNNSATESDDNGPVSVDY